MRENRKKIPAAELQDPEANIEQIYDPLRVKHAKYGNNGLDSMRILFPEKVQVDVLKQFKSNQRINKSSKQLEKGQIRSKVLRNTLNPKKSRSQKTQSEIAARNTESIYNFNALIKILHPETPGFKNLLQSPFTKFNSIHQGIINDLAKTKEIKTTAEPLSFNSSPFTYYSEQKNSFQSGKFFIGLALTAKEKYLSHLALLFAKLACYSDPYSEMAWKKYISFEEERGNFSNAGKLAKAGFLFTHSEDLGRLYLLNAEKSQPNNFLQIQGLLASLQNPQVFQRVIVPESARLQLKYKNAWKGVKILYELICYNDFKLGVCSLILFLAKYIENIGCIDEAINLLKRSFGRSMSKLEIYTLFLEMSIRRNGFLNEEDISNVMAHSQCISGENRFKLYLQFAEYFYINNDSRFYPYVQQAYNDAKRNCAPGSGCNKALRSIYFFVTKLKGIPPMIQESHNDQVIFEKNRYFFINGYQMVDYQFSDWKYYLHYGLVKQSDVLLKASKKWPLTGRLIAEWIHCLRTSKPALQMLKLWRQKIEQVPKSGELWCEGGRIYAELGEFNNASRCFRQAMHFTPQFGDSFIEELRILLRGGSMAKIQNLKKAFFVAEPFYGQVLSYIKINHPFSRKLSMNQIWLNAIEQLKKHIYRSGEILLEKKLSHKNLTAYVPYNEAYLSLGSKEERTKLFTSYQQLDSKN